MRYNATIPPRVRIGTPFNTTRHETEKLPGVCPNFCPTGYTCVACSKPGIFICNSNGIQDDSWDIALNGTFVGNYNIGNEYRALVILPMSASGKTVQGLTGRGCTLFTVIYTTVLDSITGYVDMTMTRVAINGSGNAGDVQFACTTQDASNVYLGTTVSSVAYTDPPVSGVLHFPLYVSN